MEIRKNAGLEIRFDMSILTSIVIGVYSCSLIFYCFLSIKSAYSHDIIIEALPECANE